MKVKHTLSANATCPHDGKTITYKIELRLDRFVLTCYVQKAVKEATSEPIFQEPLTEKLAAALGCSVKTCGTHEGVLVECEV